MMDHRMITLTQICEYFNVEIEIVRDFAEFGLYQTLVCDGEIGIEIANFDRLWKIISLYQSLGVNKEGIEIILELREKISDLQEQIDSLQNKTEKLRYDLFKEGPEELSVRGLLIEIDEE